MVYSREPADADVLGVPDPGFDPRMGTVAGFEERDLPAGGQRGVGRDGLVAPPVGVFEQ